VQETVAFYRHSRAVSSAIGSRSDDSFPVRVASSREASLQAKRSEERAVLQVSSAFEVMTVTVSGLRRSNREKIRAADPIRFVDNAVFPLDFPALFGFPSSHTDGLSVELRLQLAL